MRSSGLSASVKSKSSVAETVITRWVKENIMGTKKDRPDGWGVLHDLTSGKYPEAEMVIQWVLDNWSRLLMIIRRKLVLTRAQDLPASAGKSVVGVTCERFVLNMNGQAVNEEEFNRLFKCTERTQSGHLVSHFLNFSERTTTYALPVFLFPLAGFGPMCNLSKFEETIEQVVYKVLGRRSATLQEVIAFVREHRKQLTGKEVCIVRREREMPASTDVFKVTDNEVTYRHSSGYPSNDNSFILLV